MQKEPDLILHQALCKVERRNEDVCVCIYIHIHMSLRIYIWEWVWVYLHVYIYIYVCVHIHIYLHTYVCFFFHICITVCGYKCVHMCFSCESLGLCTGNHGEESGHHWSRHQRPGLHQELPRRGTGTHLLWEGWRRRGTVEILGEWDITAADWGVGGKCMRIHGLSTGCHSSYTCFTKLNISSRLESKSLAYFRIRWDSGLVSLCV